MKKTRETRRKIRVRSKIKSTADCPRLSIFRSNRYIYAQLIDDQKRVTLFSVSDKISDKNLPEKSIDKAHYLGKKLGQHAVGIGISKAVFDRGSYKYHGRVRALAEGAREGGLKF